ELFAKPVRFTYENADAEGSLADLLRYARISGRIDYHITTRQPPRGDFRFAQAIYRAICEEQRVDYGGRYGVIVDVLRNLIFPRGPIEDDIDMTATTIAEVKLPMH